MRGYPINNSLTSPVKPGCCRPGGVREVFGYWAQEFLTASDPRLVGKHGAAREHPFFQKKAPSETAGGREGTGGPKYHPKEPMGLHPPNLGPGPSLEGPGPDGGHD